VEPAAIACLLSESFAELLEDHAVAVSVHDDTPATREAVVHHVRGRNSATFTETVMFSYDQSFHLASPGVGLTSYNDPNWGGIIVPSADGPAFTGGG
jgi:hypothetical protein